MAVNLSLRTKGVLAISVLIGYLALIGVVLRHERQALVDVVQELDATQGQLGMLEPVVNTLAHSVVENQNILNAQDGVQSRPIAFGDLGLRMELLNVTLEEVRSAFPNLDGDIDTFRHSMGAVMAAPAAHHLARVRDSEQVLLSKLQDIRKGLQQRSHDLTQTYQSRQQSITTFAIAANVVGAVASVAVILVFFTKLARDINGLKDRAAAIVGGYDGPPLFVSRTDEVGRLIEAVNRMQVDLRRWEQQMELARQQRFHQEKMAAVGSLASAIGHEVSNPIAAISGVAQFIVDETSEDARPESRRVGQFAAEILKQTERISKIMRHMATLTAPRSPDPDLLDLNALVRSTCSFTRYDKRFRGIDFTEALDHDLPAVTAVADHMTQILMNLLLNAADATEHISVPGGRRIRVATCVDGDDVVVSVADNGKGMTPDVLAKAFEERFTTKPVGRGSGIGLFVCKGLVEKDGGRIELASVPYEGTTATVRIPLRTVPVQTPLQAAA